jgi:hypothetical protein
MSIRFYETDRRVTQADLREVSLTHGVAVNKQDRNFNAIFGSISSAPVRVNREISARGS